MFWVIAAAAYISVVILVLSMFAINKREDEDMRNITYVGMPLRDLLMEQTRSLQTGVPPLYVPFQIQLPTTLEERNEIKRQKAIAYLGDKWILSPAQQVKRKEAAE